MKIDSETVIPINWVLGSFTVIVASVAAATFWVSSINVRLARIEEKLGIPAYHFAEVIPNADASK